MSSIPPEGVNSTSRSVLELSIGRRYGSHTGLLGPTDYGVTPSKHWLGNGSVSYVTGSHNFKVGFTTLQAFETLTQEPNFPEAYNFFNQVPVGLMQLAAPSRSETNMNMALGLYVQDQWTVGQLALNLGLRMDTINASAPAQVRPGGLYLDEISFPAVENIPNWKSIHPRVGAAYDLSGNGRTALKVQMGSYELNDTYSLRLTRANNPVNTMVIRTFRTWSDTNGDFIPTCDLHLTTANGECGAMADQGFGTTRVATTYDPNVTNGFNVSPKVLAELGIRRTRIDGECWYISWLFSQLVRQSDPD